jgi:hypothetical protein
MARKKSTSPASATLTVQSGAYEATLGPNGSVIKGKSVSQAQAEALRSQGKDVVVCGPNLAANRSMAQQIEWNANGSYKRCPPHSSAGPDALPHFQPDPITAGGHTFYETPNRRAL